MKLDNEFEATFVRIIGLVVFILACVGFLLVISGAAEFSQRNSSETILFVTFAMCVAFAFVGLMISTLAQVLRSIRRLEALTETQNKILNEKLAAPKVVATPKKTATAKKKAKATVKKTATKKAPAKKAAVKTATTKKTNKK